MILWVKTFGILNFLLQCICLFASSNWNVLFSPVDGLLLHYFMFEKACSFFFLFMSLLKFFLTIAVPFYLTELGYCADLISRGNHIGGRKHDLLINKCLLAFSSKWQSSQRLVNTQVLIEMQTVNSNLCRMDWIKWKEEWTAKGFTLWTKMLGHL